MISFVGRAVVPFIWKIMDHASLPDTQAHQVSFSRFHMEIFSLGCCGGKYMDLFLQ